VEGGGGIIEDTGWKWSDVFTQNHPTRALLSVWVHIETVSLLFVEPARTSACVCVKHLVVFVAAPSHAACECGSGPCRSGSTGSDILKE